MEEELKSFLKDIKLINKFLIQTIATEKYVTNKKYRKSLNRFHENIMICRRQISTFGDGTLERELNNSLSSGLEKDITRIIVMLDTEVEKNDPESSSKHVAAVFSNAAESLIRLKAIVSLLLEKTIQVAKEKESFKPVGIDIDEVIKHIDKAMETITENAKIEARTKRYLIQYIEETKQELKKETPAWKKVIGALTITATIIAGIAVAPDAFENINNAYKVIMSKPFSHPVESRDIIYQVEPLQLESTVETDTTVV